MTCWPRTILHLDMDAFYAAVEQRDNPALRGKPILVGGSGRRGVVTTASYEARVFGCRSAMPTGQALALCPHAIVVPVRMEKYAAESRRVRTILERFSPDIEPISIDEAFVDLTNVPAHAGPERALAAAKEIKQAVRDTTSLTASIGVAANKFLAKVASDLHKPDGLTVIPPGDAEAILAPLPVSVIWGVGKVAAQRLAALNIRTVADLLAADRAMLESQFGSAAAHWRELARGRDVRSVHPSRVNKSIGKEHTFSTDIADPIRLRAILLEEVEQAARSLREDRLLCGCVSLKLRHPSFKTYSRARTLPAPTDSTDELFAAAWPLLNQFLTDSPSPLRLLGVSLQSLTPADEPTLFAPADSPRDRVDALTDRIAARFGRHAIQRAASMDRAVMRRPRSSEDA